MRITTPRYKVTFDGWLYTEEKDICTDCFKRIADEIKQADTPQTDDKDTNVLNKPQTDIVFYDEPNSGIKTDCGWKQPNPVSVIN